MVHLSIDRTLSEPLKRMRSGSRAKLEALVKTWCDGGEGSAGGEGLVDGALGSFNKVRICCWNEGVAGDLDSNIVVMTVVRDGDGRHGEGIDCNIGAPFVLKEDIQCVLGKRTVWLATESLKHHQTEQASIPARRWANRIPARLSGEYL
jgi:hypothetical protein